MSHTMSCVTCHMSHVTCHMSKKITCFLLKIQKNNKKKSFKKLDIGVELVGGGCVMNLAYPVYFYEFLNLEGQFNCITGSRVTVSLLNWWILPIGGASEVEGLLSTGPTPSIFCFVIAG